MPLPMTRKSPRTSTVLSYQLDLSVDVLKEPVRIDVHAGSHASPIWIGEGVSERAGTLLDAHHVGARRFVVSNPGIWRFHGEHIARALGGSATRTPSRRRDGDPAAEPALRRTEPILVPDGERYKTLQSVSRIYDALIRAGADRGSAIVGLGGGVVGDTAGFAAATFLRGLALAHIPTTLLAQVDSSIGGKVGVNHALGKNLIGAFYQPAAVLIDPLLLGTLPRREFRSGLYEVVKYGMIANRDLFDRVARDTKAIFAREPGVLLPAIVESCRIKAEVVSKDERESGLRRILNYGHTVGHALEAVTRYRRFRHGEAIAYGMLAAADLAVARGALADRDRQALARQITQLGPLPPVVDLSIGDMMEAIRRDKKIVAGKLHFVIAIQIGATMTIDDVTEDELKGVLKRLGLKR
jgi:3-dehydroquinate synthase